MERQVTVSEAQAPQAPQGPAGRRQGGGRLPGDGDDGHLDKQRRMGDYLSFFESDVIAHLVLLRVRQLRDIHVCPSLPTLPTSNPPVELQQTATTREVRELTKPKAKVELGPGSFNAPAENTATQPIQIIHRTLKMRRPATFILAAVAACATMSSEHTADAMALVPRRATPKPTGTSTKPSSADSSLVPSVPSTALFARPSQTSGNAQAMTSSSAAASSAPTKIDTSSFGRDADDIDSYRSQMLDLVYHRSMHRAGLE